MKKEHIITSNSIYNEYNTSKEMYEDFDNYINNGYKIIDTVNLAIELEKDDKKVLLSFHKNINMLLDIKEQIKNLYEEYEIVNPDYNHTFLNTISTIRKNFGYNSDYVETENFLDKKYNHVIILVLDGMGINILNEVFPKDSFIKENFKFINHSIFPSTTAAATTSIKTGKSPITTGWTGWENYIREINKDIVLFTGCEYGTSNKTSVSYYEINPIKMFYEDMNIDGFCIEPNFNINHKIEDVLNESLEKIKNSKESIQYVYYTEPDTMMHIHGTNTRQTRRVCKGIDKKIKKYISELPENTMVIITADHGHTDVLPLEIYACKTLYNLLERMPSNDSRCLTFKVKENMTLEFEELFNNLFKGIYKLYKTEDAIKQGFFGKLDDARNERINDFLGDFVAIAINKYYFIYKENPGHIFKSHHAGITKNEMLVPVCIIKK